MQKTVGKRVKQGAPDSARVMEFRDLSVPVRHPIQFCIDQHIMSWYYNRRNRTLQAGFTPLRGAGISILQFPKPCFCVFREFEVRLVYPALQKP